MRRRHSHLLTEARRLVDEQVSDDTMKSRILKRGMTSGRSDDNEKTVVKRLQTFHANNQPVVDYYNKQKKLCNVNLLR